jgi:hypothetical protein
MNIKEAKEQIKNAMTAYFARDEFGNYVIPVERQRPVFLMGPPGIGKTAVMEQIAQEMGVALVSYSMTHHTRQSALGLPFIETKNYGGREYKVSEYTMSEIIASVYDMMEETGKKEGILFLDEINCVSETLAPAMLQFLQYKIFGRHKVPEGWIVVTAGNPPEYNKSVREFDIVTWDRLKRIDVEPDFDAWKEYAEAKGVAPSIMTYLEIRKGDFYRVETTVAGKSFVTARGWDDLSQMISLYESRGMTVDEGLIGQYIQNRRVAKEFAVYYDLFNKYRGDYQVEKILAGQTPNEVMERAKAAKFDERLSLIGLLLSAAKRGMRGAVETEEALRELRDVLRGLKDGLRAPGADAAGIIAADMAQRQARLDLDRRCGGVSRERERTLCRVIAALQDDARTAAAAEDPWDAVSRDYEKRVEKLKAQAGEAGAGLSNLFAFCREAFGDESQEMLILVTELTASPSAARFIGRWGSPEYFEHNRELLFYERRQDIAGDIDRLEGKTQP